MNLLDILIVLLIVMWLGGYSFKFGGNLIHLLLVIAIVVFIARFLNLKI